MEIQGKGLLTSFQGELFFLPNSNAILLWNAMSPGYIFLGGSTSQVKKIGSLGSLPVLQIDRMTCFTEVKSHILFDSRHIG